MGWCLISVGESLLNKAVGLLREPAQEHFSYLFCLTTFVDEFKEATTKLETVQKRLLNSVKMALRNDEVIDQDLQMWLEKAEKILGEINILEKERLERKGCFMYQLSKKLKDTTREVLKFQTEGSSLGHWDRPGPRADIIPFELSQRNHFNLPQASKAAFNTIMDLLKNDEVNMIGLYGMGGIGKTTLVQQIGRTAIQDKLFDKVLMVVFSDTPDIEGIQDKIALQLNLRFDAGKNETSRAGRLLNRLKQEKNILIVLDDIWKAIDLRLIGIEYDISAKRCKYIITTRDSHICNTMRCQTTLKLEMMTPSEAWALFKVDAGLDDDSPLADIAFEVAKKCGGLPIAIVTLACALKGNSKNQWGAALKRLNDSELTDIFNINANNAYTCIGLSYDKLDNNDIKLCFLLCSLYPDDFEISREELTRLAIIELEGDGGNRSIDDRRILVEASIDTLIARCLLLRTGRGGHKVKLHDMVRHFALWTLSKSENFFTAKYIGTSGSFPTNNNVLAAFMAVSIMTKEDNELPSGLICEKLRVLLVHIEGFKPISDDFFKGMNALETLFISGPYTTIKALPEFLISLRALHLEKCKLSDIPSLKYLKKIEILSFRGSYFSQLPDGIRELTGLKLLDVSKCRFLEKIPYGLIHKLLNLEELYTHGSQFNLWGEETGKAALSELKALTRLNILSLDFESQNLPQGFVFPKLKWYDISTATDFSRDTSIAGDLSSNAVRIKKVDSTWLNAFRNLLPTVNDLELVDSSGENDHELVDTAGVIICIIPDVHQEGFNMLKSLVLKNFAELICLVDTNAENHATAFSSLAKLELMSLLELTCLWRGPQPHVGFKNLTHMSVVSCNKLTSLFSQSLAHSLVQLQNLKIQYCSVLENVIMEEDGDVITWDHNQPLCLGKLEMLEISSCPKLKYIVPIPIAPHLEKIEYLIETDNNELRQIFGPRGKEGCSLEIVLPHLTVLCSAGPDCCKDISCPSLRELEVGPCPKGDLSRIVQGKRLERIKLRRAETWSFVLSEMLGQSLPTLKEIVLHNVVGELNQMFHLDNHVGKPLLIVSIESLTLLDVPHVRNIWSGCIYTPNLTHLEIEKCHSLRYIFSPALAGNLPRLKVLKIIGCDQLETIISEGDPDHLKTLAFPNLEKIWIRGCLKLKYIFPVSVARNGLQRLSSLEVALNRRAELERVFESDEEEIDEIKIEEEIDDTKIVLPLLAKLSLPASPKFRSFSPSGHHFVMPHLNDLCVSECATSFTFASSDGSVHAETKDDSEMASKGKIVWRRDISFNSKLLPPYLPDESSSSLRRLITDPQSSKRSLLRKITTM